MGSKRDGVRVEYAKHHIRTSKLARAKIRAGTHPSQAETPSHRKRAKPRKVQAFLLYESGERRKLGNYATRKAALSAIENELSKEGTLLSNHYTRMWGNVTGYEVIGD